MPKRKAAQASIENENEQAPKKRRGSYFKWYRSGTVPVPASTKVSRAKTKETTKNVKRILKTRNTNLGKTARSKSHKVQSTEFSVPPIGTNRQLENFDDGLDALNSLSESPAALEESNGPIEHHEQCIEAVCSSGSLFTICGSSQETSLPASGSDFPHEEPVQDPLYEVLENANEFNEKFVFDEKNDLDENFDLDENCDFVENCDFNPLCEKDFCSDYNERDDDSDDNDSQNSDDSDTEVMLSQAPDLHLSEENKIYLLLLLATKKRHNLSYSAAEDMMELAEILSSDKSIFLPSRHLMKKAIEKYSAMTMTEHHVCPRCGSYVGIVNSLSFKCDKCNTECSTEVNKASGNIFLYLSLADQIKSIIKHCHNEIVKTGSRQKICPYNFEDIYDGKAYKKMIEDGCLTMNCFVDGLQVSSTSKRSAWPVLGCINELPMHLRRKHILMSCLWLGLKKPNCQEYLKPFVKECNDLERDGVAVRSGYQSFHFRIKTLICISDTIARPLLRNSTQFNGESGCGLCYHPGVSMRYKKGAVRSYSFSHGEYPLRTHSEIMNDATVAEDEGKPINGIKGKSIFSEIKGFNVASGLDLDFFHVLVNVAKRFAYLWFSERLKSKPYNLFNKFAEVDDRLLKIRPTSDVARAPRSLKDRSDFRGHEWFHWVVEYSLPVLKNVLPARYLNHWGRLVYSVAFLMQNSVSKTDVVYCDRFLKSFVQGIDHLYGPQHVTISVHLLTHLGESVFNFGQPWTHSAFMFESFNHEIKKFVVSSNGISKQIIKGMQLKVAVKNLEDDVKHAMSASQIKYFKKQTVSGFSSKVNPNLVVGNISFLGKSKQLTLSSRYLEPLRAEGLACKDLLIFERCLFQGDVFHSSTYSKVTRQNNSVVLLDDQTVFSIDYFVAAEDKSYILGRILPRNSRVHLCDIALPHIMVLQEPEDLIRCYEVSFINCKLLSFTVNLAASQVINIACLNVLQQEMLR